MKQGDVAIIGGGPAGLSAAVKLYMSGIKNLLVLERESQLGGVLRQCIHDGFGLTRFGESLSGPEYADRFIDKARELGIPCKTGTAVIGITKEKLITAVSREGLLEIQAKAVILAMGCRERTRGALSIPGERPSGVFTAGAAQAYMNLYNRMPAKKTVILGSGDIGMIMARRLTLEGSRVLAVYELQHYASGLPRNIEQCLHDYNIPLFLGHTVTAIHGDRRLTGVTIQKVDEKLQPIPGTEEEVVCDTLILSVGLIPENELSVDAGVELDPRTQGAVVDENFETSVPGIFSAGNVLHVHDLVDFVSLEAEELAAACQSYLTKKLFESRITMIAGNGIHHTVPMKISGKKDVVVSLRVSRPVRKAVIIFVQNGTEILRKTLKKAIPAEMIRILLPRVSLQGGGEIEVQLEEISEENENRKIQ